MPRKVLAPQDQAVIQGITQPPPPSPIIQSLRKDYRWAGISQFLFTFADAFGSFDFDIELLEADFDGPETNMIPDLIVRLLVALTWNRQINLALNYHSRDSSFDHLRTQYAKRAPERNPLGTKDEPIQWASLGLSQKVGVLWDLCEWQFVEPARFRSLLKSEEDAPSWRVDPLGWDKAGNTYFLFDDNRLWVQREPPAPPRPPKKSSQKAKKAARAQRRAEGGSKPKPPIKSVNSEKNLSSSSSSRSLAVSKSHHRREAIPRNTPPPPPLPMFDSPVTVSGTRNRKQVEHYGNPTPTAQALKRGSTIVTPKTDRSTRSSGVSLVQSSPLKASATLLPSPPIPRGTRISRRLRNLEDEWQPIPDEWLHPEGSDENGKRNGRADANADEDNESDLTELTDEAEHQAKSVLGNEVEVEKNAANPNGASTSSRSRSKAKTKLKEEEMDGLIEDVFDSPLSNIPDDPEERPEAEFKPETREVVKNEDAEEELAPEEEKEREEEEAEEVEVEKEEIVDDLKVEAEKRAALPENFVEWEAVCVTLYDWKKFPEQFAKSRDPNERALYSVLMEVSEKIVPILVEREKERIRELAVLNRKRSSRIAMKELEREAAARREAAQREMEERMERSRFEAERLAQEAAEALARERAREERLREREERLAARQQIAFQKAQEEERIKEQAELERSERKRRRETGKAGGHGDGNSFEPTSRAGSEAATSGNSSSRWELACEVCGVRAWNPPEETDLVCCDLCGRWQHTKCHDSVDLRQGKGLRDWDSVDFVCLDCRERPKRPRFEEESAAGAGADVGGSVKSQGAASSIRSNENNENELDGIQTGSGLTTNGVYPSSPLPTLKLFSSAALSPPRSIPTPVGAMIAPIPTPSSTLGPATLTATSNAGVMNGPLHLFPLPVTQTSTSTSTSSSTLMNGHSNPNHINTNNAALSHPTASTNAPAISAPIPSPSPYTATPLPAQSQACTPVSAEGVHVPPSIPQPTPSTSAMTTFPAPLSVPTPSQVARITPIFTQSPSSVPTPVPATASSPFVAPVLTSSPTQPPVSATVVTAPGSASTPVPTSTSSVTPAPTSALPSAPPSA